MPSKAAVGAVCVAVFGLIGLAALAVGLLWAVTSADALLDLFANVIVLWLFVGAPALAVGAILLDIPIESHHHCHHRCRRRGRHCDCCMLY